jgi:hypothetical protein
MGEDFGLDLDLGLDGDFDFEGDFDGDGDFDGADEDIAKKMFDPDLIEVMIVTEGDDLVCEDCMEWDGVIVTLAEAFDILPIHPNCRCTIEYADDEDDEAKLEWYENVMKAWGYVGYSYGGMIGEAIGMIAAGVLFFPLALYSYGIKESLNINDR